MLYRTARITLAIVRALAPHAVGLAQQPGPAPQRPLPPTASLKVSAISSASDEQRRAIASALVNRHSATILELEAVVKATVDVPAKKPAAATAVMLLGRFHAVHSAGLLATHLTFLPDPARLGELEDTGAYPCVRALISIGMPSLQPVTESAEKTDDPTVLELSAEVIKGVLGPQLAAAYLHIEAGRTKDTRTRARLARISALVQENASPFAAPPPHVPAAKSKARGTGAKRS